MTEKLVPPADAACANCVFFRLEAAEQQTRAQLSQLIPEGVGVGRCHFNPPGQIGVGIQYTDDLTGWRWPIVPGNGFCSHFETKPI